MIRYIRPFLTSIILLIANLVFAQATNSGLDQTLNNLQKQAADFPFEKVYLHLDKPYYGAGDTIWFKAYTVIGAAHRLSGRSNVLNVELIDQQNNIKKSIKLPLISGITKGDFALADTIHEGSYRIRAYTNWMRNAGEEYFFEKTISIVNAVSNKVFATTAYTYTLNNGQQSVNATINYSDLQGNPYVNKEVKYEVQLSQWKTAKGKGTTDDKGNLSISFNNPTPGTSSTGQIMTTISVDNQKIVNHAIPIKATLSKADVQFFPESGNLVNGIPSKVAFKAVNADGLGADIKGTIIDEQGVELTKFNTTHLGMGTFMLTPQNGKNYRAHITYADGTQNVIDLPKALDKGYVLAIDNQTDSLNISVKITGNDSQNTGVTLVAQSGGEIFLQGKGKPGKTSFTAVIPKSKLPSGIVQFTLFSDSGEPLNERLLFVQNPDQLKLSVNTTNQTYSPRQKVKVMLNAKDVNNQPVQGNFSVAVIDETKVPVDENTENTILSNLLLTSDLRGYIEQPNYYFAHINGKTQADLDVLMLTQGYHRFEWKQIRGNVPPDINYQPEKAITIAGWAKTRSGKPIANNKITLVNNSSGLFAMDTLTDKNGRFVFNLDFRDSSWFTLKTSAGKADNILFELDNMMAPADKNKYAAEIQVNVNKGLENYLLNNKRQYDEEVKYGIGNHSTMLKEVKINIARPKTEKELRIERAVEFSANLNGKGNADQIITSEELEGKGCAMLTDCLWGKLVGITFSPGGGAAFLFRAPTGLQTHKKVPMLIMIDGIYAQGGLNSVNIEDISSIEVLKTGGLTAIYGSRAAGGVLVITTKHGTGFITDAKNDPSAIKPKGYYISREFYSPQYNSVNVNNKIADMRTTIYWKPIVQTDEQGNASFEFFNADGSGDYRIVVEGIDYNGSLGRQIYQYKVQ